MENALRRRLELLKSRAREIRRLYLERNGLPYGPESGPPRTLAEIAPGQDIRVGSSAFYRLSSGAGALPSDLPALCAAFFRLAACESWRALALAPFAPQGRFAFPAQAEHFCFFDIETTGLTPSTYVFLCGMMFVRDGEFVIEQAMARDYAEEPAMLEYVRRRLNGFPVLITFNGSSFDIPFLRTRMAVARMDYAGPSEHVDLLIPARRAFGGHLPNCRLETIERHLRGERDSLDIPGRDIPEAYHEFVRTGDARKIGRILYHNRMDLIAMAGLFNRLLEAQRVNKSP